MNTFTSNYSTYPTLLNLHTITVLPLTTVHFMSEARTLYFECTTCTVLHLSTMLSHIKCIGNSHITVQSSTIVLLRSTVDIITYHSTSIIKPY